MGGHSTVPRFESERQNGVSEDVDLQRESLDGFSA
jgi:hypothetical protein